MEEIAKPTNFIEDIIDADLKSGKHTAIATRFPPEPNGYLHIGHAKAVCINFGIKEKYHGTCNLRFDDTNPSKEDVEYVNSIQEDIKWLGFEWDALYYASDYFEKMYETHKRRSCLRMRPFCGGNQQNARHSYRTRRRKPVQKPPGR